MTGLRLAGALALCLYVTAAQAQERTLPAELEALGDQIFQARTAISLLRTGDFQLREELTRVLETVQQDAATLRARLSTASGSAEGTRDALRALQGRVDAVRRRARSGESVSGQGLGPTAVAGSGTRDLQPLDIPANTVAAIRLLQAVDSAAPGHDVVEAVTAEPVTVADRLIAPTGSLLRGTWTTRANRSELVFHQIQIGYTTWAVDGALERPMAARLKAGDPLRLRLSPTAPNTAR